MSRSSFLWDQLAGVLLVSCVLPLPLRSDRNRRYIPRQRVEQAHARAPSDLRDSAPSSYSPFPLSPLCCRRDTILVWQVARLEKGELHDARRRECLPSISHPLACAWPDVRARVRPTLSHRRCVAEV